MTMNFAINTCAPTFVEESKFVEVLTSEDFGELIGYRIGGGRPGPSAVLAGDPALIEALFERFMAIPTLPWMWGRLHLVSLEFIESANLHELQTCLLEVKVDGLIMLPYARSDGGLDAAIEDGYWAGLRLCSQLGMIEGRGVKPSGNQITRALH
ncbi:hypothetical protein [uncultured Sulfitobacter sp.]|uniref:hypothetical protein n=1 Tax=uncultured Sulfitobacter sp. TaxID=191468 RepID=UPI00261107A9|nr:hypothetical protein [uncultured Sulfitobacter sp.]